MASRPSPVCLPRAPGVPAALLAPALSHLTNRQRTSGSSSFPYRRALFFTANTTCSSCKSASDSLETQSASTLVDRSSTGHSSSNNLQDVVHQQRGGQGRLEDLLQSSSIRGVALEVGRTAAAFLLTSIIGTALLLPMPAAAALSTRTHTPATSTLLPAMEVASAWEDQLKEGFRDMESSVDVSIDRILDTVRGSATDGAGDAAARAAGRELIQEVWEVVDQNYMDARGAGFDRQQWAALRDKALSGSLRDQPSAHRAVKVMLAKGMSDPYTRFVGPKEFTAMMKYDVTGVGLNLGTGEEYTRKTGLALPEGREGEQGGVWVMGVVKASAADRAGVQQGDQLLVVDGTTLGSRSPFEASSLLQGEESPVVSASVASPLAASSSPPSSASLLIRKVDGSDATVSLSRPVRRLESSVETKVEGPRERRVGVIRLKAFTSRTQPDVVAAIGEVQAKGAVELILDLRDNPGGLVNEGIEVARLFLDAGARVVITEGRQASNGNAIMATGTPLTRIPLTILVNQHTASSSEILAGALKDNCRATLVGDRTYGKGLIQSVYELSDSSGLVLTVARYKTPAMVDIDREGIQPDFRQMPEPEVAAARLKACIVPVL